MTPEPDADLHGTAFLYAAGDLPEAEEAAFERRLAGDQAAREAVAGAVELAGILAALGPADWTRARARPRRPLARRVLPWSAAAACLVVAGLAGLRSAATPTPDASEIAMAWSGLRRIDAAGGDLDGLGLGDDPPATDPHPAADPALPSWLLIAASPEED
jgi:hypothetical protein